MGTSVFATGTIASGTALVHCKRQEALTAHAAITWMPLLKGLSNRQCIATVLALHKQAARIHWLNMSFPWAEYVETLPEEILSPMFYTDHELALLQHTNLYGSTVERRQEWANDHMAVLERLSTLNVTLTNLPLETYMWACVVLSSRAFPSHLVDPTATVDTSVPILLPGLDVFNHNNQAKVLWQKDPDGVTLITEQEISQDQQAFNNYGPKSNEELIYGYGFAIEDNPADLCALKLAQPRRPPGQEDLAHHIDGMLQLLKLSSSRHTVFRSGEMPLELLAQMRLFLANQEDMTILQERIEIYGADWRAVLGKSISLDNEITVHEQLLNMLTFKLQSIQGGSELSGSDGLTKGLSFGNLTARPEVARIINIYKRGQQDILEKAISLLDEACEKLIGEAEGYSGAIEAD